MEDALLLHWRRLADSLGAPPAWRDRCWEELARQYGRKQRAYHNLQHISDLLSLADEYRRELSDPQVVELAVWYHDLVYVPGRSDNEERSARRAEVLLPELGLSSERTAAVGHLIRRTARHRPTGDLADEGYFLDFDLSVLGRSWEAYRLYAWQIRREYRRFPDLVYRPGRRKVLRQFLDRPSLFFTPAFRRSFEAQARENLSRELEELTK